MQNYPLSDIHTLFAVQVARTPDQTALMFGAECWSYRELNERSNQIARELRNHDVGRESIVAVLMDRSCDMIATILAVLKTGGAYAPLDPNDPPARIHELIATLQPQAICRDGKYAGLTAAAQSMSAVVDVEAISLETNAANLEFVCLPDALAYV